MSEEYIEREALIKDMRDYADRKCACGQIELANGILKGVERVRNFPAANVAEVRTGHWIGEGDGYADGEIVYDVWYCSECNYCIDDGTDDPEKLPRYCQGCGARMDGAG